MEQDGHIDDPDQPHRVSFLECRLRFWGKMYIFAALIYFTIMLFHYLRSSKTRTLNASVTVSLVSGVNNYFLKFVANWIDANYSVNFVVI